MGAVAVIGAGVMGVDVALTCAGFGHPVTLEDIDPGALRAAREGIPARLRGYRMMGGVLATWDAGEVLGRIRFTPPGGDLSHAGWVVENVPEDWDVKRGVYARLRERIAADAYVAVNTSCIPVGHVAALLPRPERVVGMHFMNPVPLKRTVEVIRAAVTSEETLTHARALLESIGKKAIVVRDVPGFVSNRVSHLFMNEAALLVEDRVASPAEVDAIFRDGYGHKMGPLETADLIGLDTVVKSLDVLYHHYQDPKFRASQVLRRMVAAGDLGRKSGKGFYEYGA
jgi:3-hydroxybutyryl-CoA dehydrogenase